MRKVDKDRTVSLEGVLYEAPVPLVGKTVTLLYHDGDPVRVEIMQDGASHGMLVPLDVHVNARVRRFHHGVDIIAGEPKDRIENGQLFGREQ